MSAYQNQKKVGIKRKLQGPRDKLNKPGYISEDSIPPELPSAPVQMKLLMQTFFHVCDKVMMTPSLYSEIHWV